jgi:hypothetical protein
VLQQQPQARPERSSVPATSPDRARLRRRPARPPAQRCGHRAGVKGRSDDARGREWEDASGESLNRSNRANRHRDTVTLTGSFGELRPAGLLARDAQHARWKWERAQKPSSLCGKCLGLWRVDPAAGNVLKSIPWARPRRNPARQSRAWPRGLALYSVAAGVSRRERLILHRVECGVVFQFMRGRNRGRGWCCRS